MRPRIEHRDHRSRARQGDFKNTRDSKGVNYRIVLEPTPENLSIRERMAYESNRIPLGIVDDGQMGNADQGDDLQALLPLEWDYLYVLCSRTLLNEVVAAKNEASGEASDTAPSGKETFWQRSHQREDRASRQ